MNNRSNQNIVFCYKMFFIKTQLLIKNNRLWMLLTEIRVCRKDSIRILSSLEILIKNHILNKNKECVFLSEIRVCTKDFIRILKMPKRFSLKPNTARNQYWLMLLSEIRICKENPIRILNLTAGFTLKAKYWISIRYKCVGNPRMGISFDQNIQFGWGFWLQTKYWKKPIVNIFCCRKSGYGQKIRSEYWVLL